MKRDKWVSVRLTDDEFRNLKDKAEKSGMTPSRYVRYACLGRPDMDMTPPDTRRASELLVALKRVGNNLNQLTRYAHAGKLDGRTSFELKAALVETTTATREVADLVESCRKAVS